MDDVDISLKCILVSPGFQFVSLSLIYLHDGQFGEISYCFQSLICTELLC